MKIVVVEDSMTVRMALVDRLGEEPFLTVAGQAGSAVEALATVRLCKPDAVLLDLGLRGDATGLDVLRDLRASGFAGFVYILTGSSYESAAHECKAFGANGFYDKGDGIERLIADLGEIALGTHVEQLRTARSLR